MADNYSNLTSQPSSEVFEIKTISPVQRESTLSGTDCKVLMRKFHQASDTMVEYLWRGCPKKGVGNDFSIKVDLWDVKNYIEELLKKK